MVESSDVDVLHHPGNGRDRPTVEDSKLHELKTVAQIPTSHSAAKGERQASVRVMQIEFDPVPTELPWHVYPCMISASIHLRSTSARVLIRTCEARHVSPPGTTAGEQSLSGDIPAHPHGLPRPHVGAHSRQARQADRRPVRLMRSVYGNRSVWCRVIPSTRKLISELPMMVIPGPHVRCTADIWT